MNPDSRFNMEKKNQKIRKRSKMLVARDHTGKWKQQRLNESKGILNGVLKALTA